MMRKRATTLAGLAMIAAAWGALAHPAAAEEPAPLRAGAAAVNVDPEQWPAIVNGGFLRREAGTVHDPLHARAIVIEREGAGRIAIVVVDSCMMPRDLLDEAKALAAERTGIAADRILISATHTHTAPAAMGALGCEVDAAYAPLLPPRIAEAIAQADARLAPAEIGYANVPAPGHTANRRWIFRPGVVHNDPFGEATVRANMHPGSQNPDAAGPSGPVDDELSILAIRAADDHRPIALLGAYAMHYFGSGVAAVSADYFGRFADIVEESLTPDAGGEEDRPPFVAMMANGTSGDLWWKDYSRPDYSRDVGEYAGAMADLARQAYESMTFHAEPVLAMAETKITLDRRTPDADRLAWARETVERVGDRPPRNQAEVYAFEQIYLHEQPTAELILQAIRIGDFAITAIPNEVYAITGLKLKHHSPLQLVMNISLANGSEGYIPPPEQHALGGYNTWPARTAALEVEAEPKIADAVLSLLEQVADAPRRPFTEPESAYARHVRSGDPLAYYRMGEFAGPTAHDATGHGNDAAYESFVVFALPGPDTPAMAEADAVNRSPHFAGGRMRARLDDLGESYSVELWFWTGIHDDLYPVTGYLFSRGPDEADDAPGDHLGIGGTHNDLRGRLFFYNGDEAGQIIAGETRIEPRTWHHAVLVRDGDRVSLYLNGQLEASGTAEPTIAADVAEIFLGGRNDNFANFPGRIDEVAIHNRALDADEIAARYRAATEE